MGEIALKHPGVENAIAFPGLSINGFTNSSNAGIVFVDAQALRRAHAAPTRAAARSRWQLNQQFAAIPDAFIAIFPPPPVQGLGTTGGFKLQIEDRASLGYEALDGATKAVPRQGLADARARGHLLELPGERAAALRRRRPHQGAPARRAGDRGVRHDADLPRQPVRERLQQVRAHVLGARAGRRARSAPAPRTSASLKVRSNTGEMVPLSALIDVKPSFGPERAMRYNGFLAADMNGRAAPGFSSGQAQDGHRAHRGARRCRRASATSGPSSPTRRSSRAIPPRWIFPLVDPARVPRARRALREPRAAAVDHPHRADGARSRR